MEWQIEFVDSAGVIDEDKRLHLRNIKSKENLFAQDLDGDGSTGLDLSALSLVTTDSTGDLLKTLGQTLFFVDNNDTDAVTDDLTFELVDYDGNSEWFDYSESWGEGDYMSTYTRSAHAVESSVENGNTVFTLAVKESHQYGSGNPEVFWQTYKIREKNIGENDWYIDWDSTSFSRSARRLEVLLEQDLNGNGIVDSGSIQTTNLLTDTSTTGSRAATLAVDDEGSIYIKRGTNNPILIEDSNGPVSFDFSETWGSISRTSQSFAVEGILNDSGNDISHYKLAIQKSETNSRTGLTTTFWETYEVSAAGILDWNSGTWGNIKTHEVDLNQDLDRDGEIWSSSNLRFTEISTDPSGDRPFLDSDNNLYIQAAGTTFKSPVKSESGDQISFNFSITNSDGSTADNIVLAVRSLHRWLNTCVQQILFLPAEEERRVSHGPLALRALVSRGV